MDDKQGLSYSMDRSAHVATRQGNVTLKKWKTDYFGVIIILLLLLSVNIKHFSQPALFVKICVNSDLFDEWI